MGCCGGDREKNVIKNDVKWEYVNLNDFKSTSCFTPFAYVYLWLMLFVSISVYAVDTFTAVNLLAFNKWAGQIKPEIDLKYSRWIFAGCIILSFVLLIYRWIRALRVMRGGKVAKAYLDPLAVRIESIRMGQEGRGWKRFLVFAELTKSRKGADYIALFAYYSFEAWLRIIFAEGPRVVINGITLYAYAEANFVPTGDHAAPEGESPFVQFWKNFGVLAEEDQLQTAIILGMLWTCLIWIISAISLAVSVILYLVFLWHHIPSDSGGLSGYCRTKINRRMERIVKTKTDKALKKENELRARQEAQAYREGTAAKRQPTLPDITAGKDATPSMPPLSRQTTMTTLPEYESRPGTAVPPEHDMPPMPALTPLETTQRPGQGPRRHMTNASDASWSSYNSNAPLMGAAGDMGYSPADRIQTPGSNVSTPWSARPGPPGRSFTEFSQYNDRPFTPGPPRPGTSQSNRGPNGSYPMEPLGRPGTSTSQRPRNMRQSGDSDTLPPARGMTPVSASSAHAPMLPDPQRSRALPGNYNPYFPPVSPIPEHNGRESPAMISVGPPRSHTPVGPPPRSFTPGHAAPLPRLQTASPFQGDRYMPPPSTTPAPPGNGTYTAFNPNADRNASPAPTYRSYTPQATQPPRQQHPMMPRTESPTNMNDVNYGFDRSFSGGPGGRQSPQYPNSGNLQPPRPQPPARGGSFDDILDHY